MKLRLFIIVSLFVLLSQSIYCLADNIPLYPCDYYGVEESSNTLKAASIITAKDPDNIAIGSFIIKKDGQYGLLSCAGDDSSTPEDEGAVDGDVITFYIDGIKQQSQAIYKAGDVVKVNLGTATNSGAYNLHLLDMPGYSSYNNNIDYSAAAVADMILDYLVPANTDTQAQLMSSLDLNSDLQITGSELAKILNSKSPAAYHYGTTSDIQRYSDRGLINTFDAANQDDCIKHMCHWLAYDIPNAPVGKENIPVAVCTSSDTAINADSDYKHWMSVVGIRTNQDPCPNLPDLHSFRDSYDIPDTLELYGVYVNDPGQEGLGFHSYVASNIWTSKYFRPIKAGLPEAGKYVAIFEPPDSDALEVTVKKPSNNKSLQVALKTPEASVSIYIPGWKSTKTQRYLLSVLKSLKGSDDFANLVNDLYFGKALKNAQVKRCFKVDGKTSDDYTIIPFDKRINKKNVTTAAMIMNNVTGQFQMAFADPESSELFRPMPLSQAYRALRKEVKWNRECPINKWLSNSTGNALFPGWSIVTSKKRRIDRYVTVTTTHKYTVTPDKKITIESPSPQVQILGTRYYRRRGGYNCRYLAFRVKEPKDCIVSISNAAMGAGSRFYKSGNEYFLTISGRCNISCDIKLRTKGSNNNLKQGGVTYIYLR